MANLFKTEIGLWNAFIGKLAEANCTAEMVKEANDDPEVVRAMVAAAARITDPIFMDPHEVLDAFEARNRDKIPSGQFRWEGPAMPEHKGDSTDAHHGVGHVLVANLGTVTDTIDFMLGWIATASPDSMWRRSQTLAGGSFIKDPFECFGAQGFKPWTLRWATVSIDNTYPTRHRASGSALMYMVVQHPKIIERIGSGLLSGFPLPGVCVTMPGGGDYVDVSLRIDRANGSSGCAMTVQDDWAKQRPTIIPIEL